MFDLSKLRNIFDSQRGDEGRVYDQLDASNVPITSADCRSCSNPCNQGHDEYPSRFDIDTGSQLLGTVKPYCRQVLISTGKSDWDHEVTKIQDTLASYLLEVQNSSPTDATAAETSSAGGIFRPTESNRVSIINASHHTISTHDECQTALVFPDYTLVMDVPRSLEGAQALWDSAISPAIHRDGVHIGDPPLKSRVLPYACVVLICSHKRRDKRCGIAAPKLEEAFIKYLEMHSWHVETNIDAVINHESASDDLVDLQHEFDRTLKISSESKRVLILRTSHLGGHKYAGNCIIYTPQGSGVWYGRVSPHEVESIVTNTIINGLVLPPLLRGGLNLSRPGCTTLHEW